MLARRALFEVVAMSLCLFLLVGSGCQAQSSTQGNTDDLISRLERDIKSYNEAVFKRDSSGIAEAS